MLDIATNQSQEARIFVINLRGRIDTLTARDFDTFFEELIRAGHRFYILRAPELEYISSAGLSAIMRFMRQMKSLGGAAVFVGLNAEICLLLEFFGLSKTLPNFDSMRAAEEHLESLLEQSRYSLELEQERVLRKPVSRTRKPERTARTSDWSDPNINSDAESDANALYLQSNSSSERMLEQSEFKANRFDTRPIVPRHTLRTPAGAPRMRGRYRSGRSGSDHAGSPSDYAGESSPEQNSDAASDAAADSKVYSEYGTVSPGTSGDARRTVENGHRNEAGEQWSPGRRSGSRPIVVHNRSVENRDDKATTEEHESAEPTIFTDPQLVSCGQCGVTLRVYHSGAHLCPGCGIEFDVRRDGSASYFEKL